MLLLVIFIILGLITGILFKNITFAIKFAFKALQISVYILLFVMGYKLAIKKDIFIQQKSLFFEAIFSSIILFVIFLVYSFAKSLIKKIYYYKIKFIKLKKISIESNKFSLEATSHKSEIIVVLVNLGFIILGFLSYFLINLHNKVSAYLNSNIDKISQIILLILLFFVGFDLGRNIVLLKKQKIRFRYLFLPLESIAITFFSSLIFGMIFSKKMIEAMIIYGGLGWYSLSSVILSINGFTLLAVYSFIHNVSRELIGILSSPIVSKFDPYLPILIGGATSMDVMLPFIQRYSGQIYTMASFFSGAFCSLSVSFIIKGLINIIR